MELLDAVELQMVNGGFGKWLIVGLALGITFLASTLYGFFHPTCN